MQGELEGRRRIENFARKKTLRKTPLPPISFPARTPVLPKMSAASMAMPTPCNLSTTRRTTSTTQSANGWAKTLTRTFLTYAALAAEWMISSAPLAKPGGDSIINEKKKAQENTLLGTSKTLFLLG